MMFAVVVVGVFCSMVEHALSKVPDLLEAVLGPGHVWKIQSGAGQGQRNCSIFRPGDMVSIRVDPTSDASMIEDDLSRARA